KAVVGIVCSITEAVNTKRAGILTRGEAHPGRHCDGWNDALETAETAINHEPSDIRQPVVSEQKIGHSTIKSNDKHLHLSRESPSISLPGGTSRAARIVGAISDKAGLSRNARFIKRTPGTSAGSTR